MTEFRIDTSSLMIAQRMIGGNIERFLDKSFLFLGARGGSMEFELSAKLRSVGNKENLVVVEIYKPNVLQCKKNSVWTVIYGDGRCLPFKLKSFDVVMMVQGPEHLGPDEVGPTLKLFESTARYIVILECPQGIYEQGEIGGNKWERHLTHFDKSYFEDLGYKTFLGGYSYESLRHILAYKVL